MNGRQARGWGISAHEMTNTTTKKAANSIVGKLTAGILAVAAVLPVAPAAAQGAGGSVLVVGDSLEVGSGPYLRAALAGTPVEVDAKRSRSSAEAPAGARRQAARRPRGVVFPLGTNDLSAASLAAILNAAAELAGGRCMVVATIARPNLRGSSTAELNRVIEQFASRRRRAGGGLALGGGHHTRRAGARSHPRHRPGLRAAGSLLAEAVQGCLLGGDLGGIPAPEDPNARVPDPPSRAAPASRAGPSRRPRSCPRRS